tara:strand:+ start:213 stop:722 length:510 start_codon:yes stop_codon:yes gene_type:complete
MDIKIVDNFMPEDIFLQYSKNIIEIPWKATSVVSEGELGCELSCNKLDNFMLVHSFYSNNVPTSELYYQFIEPLLSHIKIKSLIRSKINLNPRTEKIVQHGYHVDNEINNSFTSILYLNTNDGYTQFKESGDKIESVANRLVTFPTSYYHTGSTCTNQKYRMTLNFNYF